MKKFILIIISALFFGTVFASQNDITENIFASQSQKDSTNIFEIQKFKLYPNPASSYLFIDYDVIYVKDAKIQIYNSIGSVIYSKKLEEKQDNIKVYISEFENGLYFCSLQIDGKLVNTKKIIINH